MATLLWVENQTHLTGGIDTSRSKSIDRRQIAIHLPSDLEIRIEDSLAARLLYQHSVNARHQIQRKYPRT